MDIKDLIKNPCEGCFKKQTCDEHFGYRVTCDLWKFYLVRIAQTIKVLERIIKGCGRLLYSSNDVEAISKSALEDLLAQCKEEK